MIGVSPSAMPLEMLVDPQANRMAPDNITILETVDPVEMDQIEIDGVPVCNFATPAYFNFNEGSQTDFLNYLDGARCPALRPSGYIMQDIGGRWQNKFGDRAIIHRPFMAMRHGGRRHWRLNNQPPPSTLAA